MGAIAVAMFGWPRPAAASTLVLPDRVLMERAAQRYRTIGQLITRIASFGVIYAVIATTDLAGGPMETLVSVIIFVLVLLIVIGLIIIGFKAVCRKTKRLINAQRSPGHVPM